MRVIAGKYRSRPLVSPPGLAIRPTSDRLRETLFDVLAGRVEGACFADLYAGSGAVGIEALSRGASQVWFVEQAPLALRAIRSNLRSLGIASGFFIENQSVAAALARPTERRPWDIVFLDPPYAASRDLKSTLTLLGRLAGQLLAPNGMVIAEHRNGGRAAEGAAPAETYGPLHCKRVLKQGDAALSFYQPEPVTKP
jgi:16S rRNA (guanine966-N2)-methyltransferase